MNRNTILLFTFLLAAPSVVCFGLGGKLTSPTLSRRSFAHESVKKRHEKLLAFMEKELTFIECHFLNESSYQRFGGTSKDTAEFLKQLQTVKPILYVQFRNFGEQKTAFSMDENTAENFVRIIVNSARKDFQLSDFQKYLPPPRLPEH